MSDTPIARPSNFRCYILLKLKGTSLLKVSISPGGFTKLIAKFLPLGLKEEI